VKRSFWVPVICGAVILTIGMGARQSFGIFLKPISMDLGIGREVWSFGIAIAALLMGAVSPFVGGVADRFGAARTVAAGGAVYVLGMAAIAVAEGGVMLTVGNILSGIGMAAAGMGPIFGVVSRSTPAAKRSLALGIVTAGGSFGQFAIVPLASVVQARLGDWHMTMWILAAISVLMVLLALGLRGDARPAPAAGAPRPQSIGEALREAFAVPGFWLLTFGFFVCGFHVTFVGTHLPPYISDQNIGVSLLGLSVTPTELGGWAIGLVGLFNILGSILWGFLGGKYPRKDMLTLLYLLRSLSFIVFLLLPLNGFSVLLFSATLGFLWLGTVPLTSGLVGFMFGPANMAMLFGIVFFSHQVGSFIGGWGGGKLFDLTGSYTAMWWISVALGLFAALCNWPIRERPVARLMPKPAE
jgi:MFS family permease